ADRLAGVVGAELHRVLAVDDTLIGPVELLLVVLVRGEVLERPPIRACIEGHDREAILREFAGESTAACARSDDREVHRLIERVLAHGRPTAVAKDVRARPPMARGLDASSTVVPGFLRSGARVPLRMRFIALRAMRRFSSRAWLSRPGRAS